MSIQKKNDWAVTLFFNPDKSIQDLANLGITVETSDIKDKEYYKSYPEIQEYFAQDGKFNDVAFNNFYNSIFHNFFIWMNVNILIKQTS